MRHPGGQQRGRSARLRPGESPRARGVPGTNQPVRRGGKEGGLKAAGRPDGKRARRVAALRADGERRGGIAPRSEEHTSELQSLAYLVCRLLLEKKKKKLQEMHCQSL